MKKLFVATVATALLLSSVSKAQRAPVNQDEKELAVLITRFSQLYKVERDIFSCILFTESSYRLNLISETEDYGIGQINAKTIKGYHFERLRLLTDRAYSVRAAAEVLADYRRIFKPDEINDWPARYNIGYQDLTYRNVGTRYVQYNNKIRSCLSANLYL